MPYRRVLVVFAAILIATSSFAGVSKKELQALPSHYRQWLQRDVAYIITSEEKEAFLRLTSDAERDKFIDQFWEIRNPNPGSPTNTYKDEIYRRIAYANQWFGHRGDDGWRTDRGRVYITLGKPEQVAKYLGYANERPMIIWFYSNSNPALPPFFYVVFYQREVGGEFRLYSPYMDGPEKLVTGSTEGDRLGSWEQIDHDMGREVARTVLSLIPNEPVDTDRATSSLASDVLLNTIRGLANNPINKDLLNAKRQLLESVSHRVILHGDYLDVLTISLVDPLGDTNLHYLLRFKHPDDFTLKEDDKHRWFYDASMSVRVLTPEGKQIFSQERTLKHFIDNAQLARVRNKVFGYEGVLPLPPGRYKLQFQLNNDLAKTSYVAERDVVVPQRPADFLRITDVVPFSAVEGGASVYDPFSAAGVRFVPTFDRGLVLNPGQDLMFFYQLWESPELQKATGGDLHVQYAYGRMGLQDTKTLEQDLPRNEFDRNGAMVNGKKISTADLLPGNYRMSIVVTDPITHKRAVGSFQFTISDSQATRPAWDIVDPEAFTDYTKGQWDYLRSLCYSMEGKDDLALTSLERAYQKDANELTRGRLVNLLFAQKNYSKIASLYASGGISKDTDDMTMLQMAESLDRLGQVNKSIQLLESAVALRQSGPLYLALGRYYQSEGNLQKAAEMEQKGKQMTMAAPRS